MKNVFSRQIQPNELTYTMAKYERLSSKYGQHDFNFSIKSVNAIGSSVNASHIYVPQRLCAQPSNIKKWLHQHTSQRYYNISWSAPKIMPYDQNIESYTVFWCRSKNDLQNQCDVNYNQPVFSPNCLFIVFQFFKGSIDFQRVEKHINHLIYESNDTINFAVSANSRESSSGMVWTLCVALTNNGNKTKDLMKLKNMYIYLK